MKKVNKAIEFTFRPGGVVDAGRVTKAGFRLNGEINRQDFGLTWSNKVPTGELVVSDIVNLVIRVELDKKQDTASK